MLRKRRVARFYRGLYNSFWWLNDRKNFTKVCYGRSVSALVSSRSKFIQILSSNPRWGAWTFALYGCFICPSQTGCNPKKRHSQINHNFSHSKYTAIQHFLSKLSRPSNGRSNLPSRCEIWPVSSKLKSLGKCGCCYTHASALGTWWYSSIFNWFRGMWAS